MIIIQWFELSMWDLSFHHDSAAHEHRGKPQRLSSWGVTIGPLHVACLSPDYTKLTQRALARSLTDAAALERVPEDISKAYYEARERAQAAAKSEVEMWREASYKHEEAAAKWRSKYERIAGFRRFLREVAVDPRVTEDES